MEQNTCNKCGRPMQYATEPKCNYCDSCMSEYCGCKLGRIKEIEPTCDSTAVIPSITVESVEGITNLANCLVHVEDINTTFYVDDKHRVMITWAGPVNIPGYDMETNPERFRDQIITDTEAGLAVIYDAKGVGYTFGIEQGLDVTEAVNNKIDEMAEDGSLAEIIVQYIGDNITWTFGTVAEMKLATNLIDGSYARTMGYYTIGDGGGAIYLIRQTMPLGHYEILNSGQYAELVSDKTNVKSYGAKGDGLADDTDAIQECLDDSDIAYLPNGTYLISQSLKLKENNSLIGESKINSIITTNSEIILIEPKDNYIKNVLVSNLKLAGNYKATVGICFYKTDNPDTAHVDTIIRVKSVYIHRCTEWCIMFGRNDSERALPNSVVDDLTLEQFSGGGMFLSSRCTDSTFSNIIIGSGTIGTRPNIQVEGYNLHFTNCKSCVAGSNDSHQDCWYFDGAADIYGEIEAQESTKYGVEIYQSKNMNLNILTDSCGVATESYPAVYINDAGYNILNIVCTNNSSSALESNSCIKINNSVDMNINISKGNTVPYVFDTSSQFSNSYNIDYRINGKENIDILPEFDTQSYNNDGITATTIAPNKILVKGTATADVSLPLKGGWGMSTPLSYIPENYIVNSIVNDNAQFQVFINQSSVLSSTTNQLIKTTSSNADITGLVLKILNGTTINKVIEPKLYITPNT